VALLIIFVVNKKRDDKDRPIRTIMPTLTTFPHSNINFLINQETYEMRLYTLAALIFRSNDKDYRKMCGIITSIECLGIINSEQVIMRFRLQPRLARLHTAKNYQLILNETVIDICKQLLLSIGYEPQQLYFHCSKEYPSRPYTLQAPAETDLAFLQRLLAYAGIFYWSSSDNHIETLQ
jgi:uncharacterized protein involved in type VI secretion and phage assembly